MIIVFVAILVFAFLSAKLGMDAGYERGKTAAMMQAVEAGHAIVGIDADGFQHFEWSWECLESVGIWAENDLPAPTVTGIE